MRAIKLFLAALFTFAITACGGGTQPPTISAVSPADNSAGVALNTVVTATFSDAMDPSTVTAAAFNVSGVRGTVGYSGNTAIFTPSSNLSIATTYTATITTGVKDLGGNALASNYTWSFTTGAAADTTPPAITAVSPSNHATGAAVNGAITATFSEAMNPSTISSATFSVNGVTGTVSYSGNTATFVPSSSLIPSTTYTATITTGVTDLAGNAMVSTYTWSFTTGAAADITPPTVSSTSPTNNAADVAVNGVITATFSEPMAASTITPLTFMLSNGVTGTVAYSGNTATFTPSASLAYSTSYTATITGARDNAGNAIASPYSWTFTTGAAPNTTDTTPPTVLSTSPFNYAANVAVNGAISAAFSEPMAASTINAASFILDNGITGTITYGGNTATFTPSSSLAYSTTYTATITTGATDSAGNAMAAPYIWTFTTGAAPDTTPPDITPPTVLSTSPLNDAVDVPVDGAITATFSEAMNPSTITPLNFTLDNGVTGTVTYSGTTATFTPFSSLASLTTYTATITTGVTDSAGNAMTSPYMWTFTTSATPPAPGGVSATAGNGQVTIDWNAVPGADSYNIYMASASGVTKSSLHRVKGSAAISFGHSFRKAFFQAGSACGSIGCEMR